MWILLAIALSGSAWYFSTNLNEFWPAAWVAPLPVLMVAFRSSRRTAALAAFAAYLLGGLNLFGYLAKIAPLPVVLTAWIVPGVVFAGAALFARYMVRRLPPWAAVFAFPVFWTSYEFLLALVSPHGTSLDLAYSQVDVLPVLQIASVTGLWGVTFLVTLLPSALAVAWASQSVRILVPAAAILLSCLGFGVLRLRTEPSVPPVRVGLAAADQGIDAAFQNADPGVALTVARAYAGRVARLAGQGARLVVVPEKLEGLTPGDADGVFQVFGEAARTARVTLIVGFDLFDSKPPRNVALVFGPDGRVLLVYDKHHMLPGPETGYRIGGAPGLLPPPNAHWGVAICKDMDFPDWSREYGRRGVRLLAVPAWDFVVDGRLHSRMAVVRGVEQGFAIARVAQQGRLTFSDACGRILRETASSRLADATLVTDLPPGAGPTFYTRFGNWFGWLNVFFLLILMLTAVLH